MNSTFSQSSGNVFEDLGFSSQESMLLRAKATLLMALGAYVQKFPTQVEAAKALGVSQPRVSQIANGKLSAFSMDLLVKLCERAGIEIAIKAEASE